MFVTKNRAVTCIIFPIAVVVFLTACGPPGPRALLQGRKLLEAGQTAAALKELQIAVSLLPTNAAAWNYLGLACHRAGQVTNAIEAYSRAIKLDRDLLEARFNLGCLLLDENRLDAAKTEFTAYTLRRGSTAEGWIKLGLAHLRAREAGHAEKCFREVLGIETNSVEALNGLGLVQLQRNRPREAADFFNQALKLEPSYRPALLNLATVANQQLNDRPEALRRYREYLSLQPRAADWDAVNAVVRSLEQPVAVPAAAPPRPLTNAVASNNATVVVLSTNPPKTLAAVPVTKPPVPKPDSSAVVIRTAAPPIAVALVNTQTVPQPEAVKLAPEPVVRSATTESKPMGLSSNSTLRVTNTPIAKTERRGFFSKLNPFSSDSKPAATNKPLETTGAGTSTNLPNPDRVTVPGKSGNVSSNSSGTGDRREAEAALAQGQQSQRANRDAEALQYFRRATLLDPTYFEAYYCLGLAAFRNRSFQVAQGAWEKALALRPDNGDARYNLALTLKAANNLQEAVNELEKLLTLHPDEARAHLTLGNLYAEQLRDIPRARRHYNKVLQLDPRNPQAQAIRYWLVANPG